MGATKAMNAQNAAATSLMIADVAFTICSAQPRPEWTRTISPVAAYATSRSSARPLVMCRLTLPLEQAMHPSVLVAIAQNGRSLTREHGFPSRLRAPALYGIENPKWLERIVLTDHHYEGYWQRQGWTDAALVRTESRIDAPSSAGAGEATWIAGIAWAGLRGVAGVEVSTDGGSSWRRARLERPLSLRLDALGVPLDAAAAGPLRARLPGDRRRGPCPGRAPAPAPPVWRLRLPPPLAGMWPSP
jgi:hypothetical protein